LPRGPPREKAADYNRTTGFPERNRGLAPVFKPASATGAAHRVGACAARDRREVDGPRADRRLPLDATVRLGPNDVVIYDNGIKRRGATNHNKLLPIFELNSIIR